MLSKYLINDSYAFDFETKHDYWPGTVWMQRYWWLSIVFAIVYKYAITYGEEFMARNPNYRFNLKTPLVLWNLLLALFSTAGTLRTLPDLILVLKNYGYWVSICDSTTFALKASPFWYEQFVWSKAIELGDTVFLILRRRPVTFIHWFHHTTVMVFTWYSSKDHFPPGRWFSSLNYTAHMFMYSYYTVQSLNVVKVPRCIRMSVTIIQITQFLIGKFVCFSVAYATFMGMPCTDNYSSLYFAMAVYIAYVILFTKFFIENYTEKGSKKSGKDE